MPREFQSRSTYVVRPGDTMTRIATTHGVALDLLIAANAALVTNPDSIQVGWELTIPGELGRTPVDPPAGDRLEEHIVASGDTLGALARRWSCSVAEICELNGIVNPNVIAVGQKVLRPGYAATPAAAGASAATGDSSSTRDQKLRFTRYPLGMPPARISGGYREDYGGYLHRGIDIAGVAVGTPVHAPAAGKVTTHRPGDGWGSGTFGNCVILDHPGTPWWTIYGHLHDVRCRDGDVVNAGDVIGTVGYTGRVVPAGPAGAHLHWQLSAHAHFPPDFQYIANPLDFLDP